MLADHGAHLGEREVLGPGPAQVLVPPAIVVLKGMNISGFSQLQLNAIADN